MRRIHFMKNCLLVIGLLGGSALAFSGTVGVNATVGDALVITEGVGVSYGTIVPGTVGLWVGMSPTGALFQTEDAVVESQGVVGTFSVSGTSGHTVSLSYTTIYLSSGTNSIRFVPGSTLLSECTIGTNCDTDHLKVTGSLALGANQAKGDYTGNLTITVNYNNV